MTISSPILVIMEDRIYHIGVMLGNIYTHHPMELIEGIYAAANGENVNVTLFLGAQGNSIVLNKASSSDAMKYDYHFNTLYDYALISRLDALIISYGTLCIFLEDADKEKFFNKFRHIPLIILEEYDDNSNDNYIMSDNYGSMLHIVEHLIRDHHYKKILHLSGPINNMDATQRREAYLYAMKSYDLPVTDSMIEYGDYSPHVEDIVERLLDNNEGAEAIVCANDEMAIGAYHVCKKRGLTIGKDIAITGYDDIEMANRMDPPLTTANQDGRDMGYKAMKLAVSICRDGINKKIKLPAHFKKRSSCGCSMCNDSSPNLMLEIIKMTRGSADVPNISAAASCASTSSMNSIGTTEASRCCAKYFTDLITTLFKIYEDQYTEEDKPELNKRIINELRLLFESRDFDYINKTKFTNCIHQIIEWFVTITEPKKNLMLLYFIYDMTDVFLQSHILSTNAENINMLRRKNWIVPAMIQQLMENVNNEKKFYKLALEHMRYHGAKSAYIYLLKSPTRYSAESEFKCPQVLYLASEYVNGKIKSYASDKRPVITMENGIPSRYPAGSGHYFVSFVLFVKQYQYGIMLCEIDTTAVSDLYSVGLQISTAGAFMEMSKKEAKTKQHLVDTLRTLEDKNAVLSFVSDFDQLTNLYNRRGFMENAINLTRSNKKKKGYIFFSDLDHLKEINDVYGHSSGDYALLHAADILKQVFDDIGISGRIGGDEFISLIFSNEKGLPERIIKELNDRLAELNATSSKPYYIEFSTGYIQFDGSNDLALTPLIEQADSALYKAKQSRRSTIQKNPN